GGPKVPVRLPRVLGLQQEREVNVVEAGLVEMIFEDQVIRLRGPDEVVHARLPKAISNPVAAGRRSFLDQSSGRADLASVARGNVDRDVVIAEVGKELALRVKLVAVPACLFEDADLGKPLGDEEEIAFETGPRGNSRKLGAKVQCDSNRSSRWNRPRQTHL